MPLNKAVPVEIRQVANGYLVMPVADYGRGNVVCDADRFAFQSFAELASWLEVHFTYRAEVDLLDDKT